MTIPATVTPTANSSQDLETSKTEPEIDLTLSPSNDSETAATTATTLATVTSTFASGGTTNSNSFPRPFYCPITQDLLMEPVVAPGGISYEREAILPTEKYTPSQLYFNRALQTTMEELIGLEGDTLDAGIKRFQKSIKNTMNQLLDMAPVPTDEYRALPDGYYCPITFDLMHVPVIDPEGNTFERVAIENWIQVNRSSPITRKALTLDDLYPNQAIFDLLALEKAKPDDQIHPSVRAWKLQPPPVMPVITTTTTQNNNHNGAPGPFPTTLEELEYRRQTRRRMVLCSGFGVACLILAIAAAIFYGGSCVFVSIWVACCVRDSFRRLREIRREEDEFLRLHEGQERERLQVVEEEEREENERDEQIRQQQLPSADAPPPQDPSQLVDEENQTGLLAPTQLPPCHDASLE